jgi:hypothetical protein
MSMAPKLFSPKSTCVSKIGHSAGMLPPLFDW